MIKNNSILTCVPIAARLAFSILNTGKVNNAIAKSVIQRHQLQTEAMIPPNHICRLAALVIQKLDYPGRVLGPVYLTAQG